MRLTARPKSATARAGGGAGTGAAEPLGWAPGPAGTAAVPAGVPPGDPPWTCPCPVVCGALGGPLAHAARSRSAPAAARRRPAPAKCAARVLGRGSSVERRHDILRQLRLAVAAGVELRERHVAPLHPLI